MNWQDDRKGATAEVMQQIDNETENKRMENAMNWEKQGSLYRTFQAESESAIGKFKAGYLNETELKQSLAACEKRLVDNLATLKSKII